jgi:hypothetical protein
MRIFFKAKPPARFLSRLHKSYGFHHRQPMPGPASPIMGRTISSASSFWLTEKRWLKLAPACLDLLDLLKPRGQLLLVRLKSINQ